MSKADLCPHAPLPTSISSLTSLTTRVVFPQKSFLNSGYRSKIEPFNGPYISSEPEIIVFPREDNLHALLIATDGLWDELKKPEIGNIFDKHYEDNQAFLNALLNECLMKSAMKNLINKNDLENMDLGKRRNYHDDISIVLVRLD